MKNDNPSRFPTVFGQTKPDELHWYWEASCQRHPFRHDGVDIWYSESTQLLAKAKSICKNCPVKVECLNFALQHNERLGVWGGLDPEERKSYRRAWKRRLLAGGKLEGEHAS